MTMFSYTEIANTKHARRNRRARFAKVTPKYQRVEGEEVVNKRHIARRDRQVTKVTLRARCS